jgi:hypothetical protein
MLSPDLGSFEYIGIVVRFAGHARFAAAHVGAMDVRPEGSKVRILFRRLPQHRASSSEEQRNAG